MGKIRYLMVGECERCGEILMRPVECSHAVCYCSNPYPIVKLHPVLILPTRTYNKFRRIADRAGVSVELLVNKVLELGVEKLKGRSLKEFMQIE